MGSTTLSSEIMKPICRSGAIVPSLKKRSRLAFTIAASSAVPSSNAMPWRSRKVNWVKSSLASMPSARCGTTSWVAKS